MKSRSSGWGRRRHRVVALPHPRVQQALLQGADVLELVDDEGAVLPAHGRSDVVAVLEDPHREEQDVLEVDDTPLPLPRLIGVDHLGHGRQVHPGGLATGCPGRHRIALCREHRHLGPLDLGRHVADDGPVDIDPQPSQRLGDEGRLVRLDLWRAAADGLRPEVVQLAQCRGVEGACLNSVDPSAQPGPHLAGRPP